MQVKRIRRSNVMGLTVGFLVLLIFTGCGTMLYTIKSEETKSYTITGVDYDEAFSKAVRTANEIGLSIFTSDKNAGTFYASKGLGYVEITEVNFFLEKGSQGKLTAILRIKSSKSESIAKEFIDVYSKYVKIVP